MEYSRNSNITQTLGKCCWRSKKITEEILQELNIVIIQTWKYPKSLYDSSIEMCASPGNYFIYILSGQNSVLEMLFEHFIFENCEFQMKEKISTKNKPSYNSERREELNFRKIRTFHISAPHAQLYI